MISLKNISKTYKNTPVVNNVSLDLPKGKIISLVGSNGAGKSTLLGVIARVLNPDDGQIIINERNIEDYKTRFLAQHISILKQSNHLNLKLTVKELVAFGRFPYSQGKLNITDQEKINEALTFLELDDLKDRYVDELSGGQKQRVFLAMVVAQDTDYILLDEPLNNLDMKHSVQIMKTLQALCKQKGKTIIMVVHDINFASQYSHYIAALKSGEIKYFDKTQDIIEPKKLKDVFDIDFEILEHNNKKICNYFN